MPKTHWRLIAKIERLADNLIIVCAFFLTYYLRDLILLAAPGVITGGLPGGVPVDQTLKPLGPLNDYFIVLFFAIPFFNAALSLMGAYRSMRLSGFTQLLKASVLSSGFVFLALGALLYLLKLDLSRSFVAIFSALSGILLFVERYIVLGLLRFFRIRGKNFRNVLLVGTGDQARRLYVEIVKQPELGIRVAGFVSLDEEIAEREHRVGNGNAKLASIQHASRVYDLPVRVVATPLTFEAALKKYAVDEVLFTDVSKSFQTIEELAQMAVEEGVSVSLAADFFSLEIVKSEVSYFGSFPLIHYRPTPGDGAALVMKRTIDVLVSAALLVVLSPLLLLTALLIKLTSRGPVFFKQRRVGLNGRIFTLLKFRSMVDNAEKLLPSLREQNEMKGPVFKMKNDPRVTPLGRLLRRFSIDELPQLINVLRGDMSLVGPRPPIPEEVSLYMRKQRRRLSMRPGLTCTWQVSGRNEILDFEQWAKLDLEYIDNWSLSRDLKLLLRTIPAVLSGMGAR